MSTINESLAKFKEKTDALVNSKYLFAEREISEVLKVIAGSRMLYELFEYVTDGFDYETFKSVCFSKGNAVKLPKRDEDLLALCFLLLVEIDGGRISLDEFCDEYFAYGGSAQGKYSQFVLSVVIPFAMTTEKAVNKLINEQNDGRTPEFPNGKTASENAKESPEKSASERSVYAKIAEKKAEAKRAEANSAGFIEKERRKLAAETRPKLREPAEEAAYVLDSLEKALKKRDFEAVTVAFIAIKYLAAKEKKLKIDVNGISDGIASVTERK